jgi:hypothetical protein
MRLAFVILICLGTSCSGDAIAQEASDTQLPPEVAILKHTWTKSTPRTAPFSTTVANTQQQLVLPPPAHTPRFHYSMEVKNDGASAIKAIRWDYIFDEPGSKQELGRIKLGSLESIGAHSKKLLLIQSTSSPPQVVTATGLEKDKRSPFDERVAIMCILYKDGTTWEQPSAKGLACEELRQWLKSRGKLKA